MWTPADNPPPLTQGNCPGFRRSDAVLLTDGTEYRVGHWAEGGNFWPHWYQAGLALGYAIKPTHWHPLPPLPQEEPERFPDDDRDLPF